MAYEIIVRAAGLILFDLENVPELETKRGSWQYSGMPRLSGPASATQIASGFTGDRAAGCQPFGAEDFPFR